MSRRRGKARSNYGKWTRRQDQVLRRRYGGTRVTVLMEMPIFRGRSRDAMRCRAKALGIATKLVPRRWQTDEDLLVIAVYADLGPKRTARLLTQRTPGAVADRAHHFGIYRRQRKHHA